MKRITYLFFVFSLLGSSLHAQVDFKDEKTKINEVKRDAAYIYGEGIATTNEEAYEMAEQSLKTEILRVISEDENLRNKDLFKVSTIQQNSTKIELKRGTMDRIFLYVAIDQIRADEEGIVIDLNQASPQPQEPVSEVPHPVEEKPEEIMPVVEQPAIEPQEVQLEEEIVFVEPEPEPVAEPDIMDIEEEDDNAPELYIADVSSPTLRTLLGMGNMKEIEAFFRQGKEDKKLMWGNVTSDINPSWYLLIFDDSGVQAVLDKGSNKRKNLLTGEEASVSDYQKSKKVWFIIYD